MAQNMNSNGLKCPKCGSEHISYNGIDPAHCAAICQSCHFSVDGMERVSRYFGGKASYSEYLAEKEAEAKRHEDSLRESERRRKEIAAQRAACNHEWHYGVMCGFGVKFCPKCGKKYANV